jgi:outer membrane protein TolC
MIHDLRVTLLSLVAGLWVCAPHLYADLTLSHCIDLALKHNPDFLIAQTQVQDADGTILQQRAPFLPHVGSQYVTLPPTFVAYFTQVVYTRAMKPAFDSFAAGREAARMNVELAALELYYKLRVAFAKTLYAQKYADLKGKEYALLEDKLRRAPSLFSVEKISKADWESLKVRASLKREELDQAVTQRELSRIDLAEAIGISSSDREFNQPLSGVFDRNLLEPMNLDELKKKAFESRLDLKILDRLKRIATDTVIVKGSDYYPVAAIAGESINTAQNPSFLKPLLKLLDPQSANQDDSNNDITLSRTTGTAYVNWQIWDGGKTDGAVASAKAGEMKAQVMEDNLVRQIPHQVEEASRAVRSAVILMERFHAQPLGEDALQRAQDAFDAGQASQLEVLDAQEDAIAYDGALLLLQYNLDLALAALDRAVGDKVQIVD